MVYVYDKEEDVKYPEILIECKEPNTPLTEDVYYHALYYSSILGVELMILTNGAESHTFAWEESKETYVEIQSIPKYSDLFVSNPFVNKTEPLQTWTKPNHQILDPKELDRLIEGGIIGVDSNKEIYPFLVNLFGILFDDDDKLPDLKLETGKFVEDCGLRFVSFGNASGGSYPGDYRSFIMTDNDANDQIISIGLFGNISTVDHPKYGTTIGHTMLIIAIDDFEKSHSSLQLRLDKFSNNKEGQIQIIHDGTLTAGKSGRAKNKDLIDFVYESCPYLLRESKVFLGQLDNSKPFNWTRADVLDFFSRLIDYAVVRDKFRKTNSNASLKPVKNKI